jgi:hypothetical protein
MMAGLTKTRDELTALNKANPEYGIELLEMAMSAYEQHELALSFLKVSIARLVAATAKAQVGDELPTERKQLIEQAIDLAFSKENIRD